MELHRGIRRLRHQAKEPDELQDPRCPVKPTLTPAVDESDAVPDAGHGRQASPLSPTSMELGSAAEVRMRLFQELPEFGGDHPASWDESGIVDLDGLPGFGAMVAGRCVPQSYVLYIRSFGMSEWWDGPLSALRAGPPWSALVGK